MGHRWRIIKKRYLRPIVQFLPMQTLSWAFIIGVVALFAVWMAPAVMAEWDDELNESKTEVVVVDEINDVRDRDGLNTLERDAELDAAAEDQAKWMARTQRLSHERPDGTSLDDRLRSQGRSCRVSGENIAQTFYDTRIEIETAQGPETVTRENAQEVGEGLVGGWVSSSGHRDVLTEPRFSHTGVAVVTTELNGSTGVYAVQVFC